MVTDKKSPRFAKVFHERMPFLKYFPVEQLAPKGMKHDARHTQQGTNQIGCGRLHPNEQYATDGYRRKKGKSYAQGLIGRVPLAFSHEGSVQRGGLSVHKGQQHNHWKSNAGRVDQLAEDQQDGDTSQNKGRQHAH